jgi:hypothetical protein
MKGKNVFFLVTILFICKHLNGYEIAIFHFPVAESHHEILQSLVDLIPSQNISIKIYTFEFDFQKFEKIYNNIDHIKFVRYGNYSQGEDFLKRFNKTSGPIQQLTIFLNFLSDLCESLMDLSEEIAYHKNHHFDLIITDMSFRCSYNFIKQIDAKNVIYLTPVPILPNCRISIETLSYLPYMTTPYTENLNFLERMSNLFQNLFVYYVDRYSLYTMNEINKKHNYSLLSSHCEEENGIYLIQMIPGYDYPMQLTQNMIPVGSLLSRKGDFSKTSVKIQGFYSEYTSICLIDLSKILKTDKVNFIKEIIMDLEEIGFIIILNNNISYFLEGLKLKNILIIKNKSEENFSFNDVLSNKKTKLFIMPAFQNLIYQAIYFEVNIIAIQFSLDQIQNVAKLNYRKIGYGILDDELNFSNLKPKILDCIFNSTFKKELNYYSKIAQNLNYEKIFNDVFNLSFTTGFEHLLPKRIYSLSFYEYYNLDVLLFIFLGMILILLIVYILIKRIISRVLSRNKIKTN